MSEKRESSCENESDEEESVTRTRSRERGDELSAVIERERTRSVVETRKIASLLRKAREKSVAPENN